MASEISLKLLVNNATDQVLFAEAGKEFIDFLFSLLAIPVGTVVRLLGDERMMGSIGKLYGSLQSLGDTYLQPNLNKELVLNPRIANPVVTQNTLLLQNNTSPSATAKKCCYRCSRGYSTSYYFTINCNGHFTDVSGTPCPTCGVPMTTKVNYVSPTSVKEQAGTSGGEGGYVKGVVTYMVMNDLVVSPMSTISSITMLTKFQVKDVALLEEKVVPVRIEEFKFKKKNIEGSGLFIVPLDIFYLMGFCKLAVGGHFQLSGCRRLKNARFRSQNGPFGSKTAEKLPCRLNVV